MNLKRASARVQRVVRRPVHPLARLLRLAEPGSGKPIQPSSKSLAEAGLPVRPLLDLAMSLKVLRLLRDGAGGIEERLALGPVGTFESSCADLVDAGFMRLQAGLSELTADPSKACSYAQDVAALAAALERAYIEERKRVLRFSDPAALEREGRLSVWVHSADMLGRCAAALTQAARAINEG